MNKTSEFIIKAGYSEMDFDNVTRMLKDALWCLGIKKEEVIQGAQNSALLVGAFAPGNIQIGFLRIVSDKTRFAYILDVIVDEHYRKQGVGQAMIRFLLDHPDLKDVYQWVLLTKDAHGVYKKAGFTSIAYPEGWMEIRHPRPER
jgi:ribosomal protein S18 acetylase RimI-like enzyme